MIKISKQNNSLIVEGIDNVFYPNNGDNSYPLNSLIVVTDNSDMATFRSVATNDVLFSGLIQNITINGESVTKDNIIQKFDAVSNSSTGGGTVDAYTKEEADNKFSTKDELANVQTVADDAVTKAEFATTIASDAQNLAGNKQDILVSGTNIKTVNSQSILGEGNIEVSGVSEEQAQEIAKIPTLETEIAQKANVSDVPTVQTDRNGTNKNYVYSNADSSNYNDKVVSSCEFINNAIDRLDFFVTYWGDGGPSNPIEVPLATPSTAGIMSGNDRTKLDSIPETIPSQSEIDGIAANVSALQTAMDGKQATLVSGENIKTINSQSILGSGDLTISGVSEEQAQEIAKIPTLETELAQKANASDVPTVQKGPIGTNKNYVYSDGQTVNNKGVMSQLEVGTNDEKDVLLTYHFWNKPINYSFSLPKATTSKAGIITAADKTKLDSIPENIPTQTEVDNIAANVSALETAMDGKQATLVSGTNIKTINSQSILGEGNIEVSGVSEEQAQEIAKIPTLETELAQKANVSDVPTAQTGSVGTNKNYVYSEGETNNRKGVISKLEVGVNNAEDVILAYYLWNSHSSQSFFLPKATTKKAGIITAADKTKLDSISNEWTGTQQEYDALTTKDNNTIYYVTE